MANLISFIASVWETHPDIVLFTLGVCVALVVLEYTENIRPSKKNR